MSTTLTERARMCCLCAVVVGFLSIWEQSSTAATILQLQFTQSGVSPTQAGFSAFTGSASQPGLTSQSFSTVEGQVDVSVNAPSGSGQLGGGYFFRSPGISNGGSLTYANLYSSFAYNNSSNGFSPNQTTSLTLTLSGAGIKPSTFYDLKFYAWDSAILEQSFSPSGHQVTFAGISGTSGTTSLVSHYGTAPTSNDTYAVTKKYTSDSSGNLTFLISDFYGTLSNGAARSGIRLNGFELAVPEPSRALLLLFGLSALIARRRRREW